MVLIDTHTHIYSEAFDEDRQLEITKAMKAGVQHFLLPAIDSSYYDAMKKLKADYPNAMHLMAGLHPTHVKDNFEEELAIVFTELESGIYCAVGEIGIDLYWDKSYLKQQQDAFALQVKWAQDFKLPFAIHCRDAFDEVFEVLEAIKGPFDGVFHCFTGDLQQAHRAIDLGLKLGIGGVVTFKNGKIDQFLNQIPLDHILLETDAPYLAPVPHRGTRNNPEYLTLIANKMAAIYDCSLEEIAHITTQNAQHLFKLS